ncbi:rod shape-determining protein MreC [uncultured Fusobacterium sp.]|uniref:rod shape-determining protein MreC n=1 Tax=uncultured Fusobacterium sp. TaxID=159267 RepID=UPI0025DD4739|nr:rod shape-determining protein MreC [uncultured Fusobacterium sp.]
MLRRKKNSKGSTKNKLLIVLFSIFLVFVLFKGIVNSGVEIISYVVFPIQRQIYKIGNFFKESSEAVVSYKAILEENRTLKNEYVKYDMLLMYNKELSEENERLREILKMKEEKKLNIKVAKVNFRNPNNIYERFYIDLGKKDGIKKNYIVLAGENLIGKIGKVYDDYSIVDMITGENYSVSSLTENNNLGIVRGSNEGDGTLYFEANTFQENISVGEKIYTSGISEIYPKGIYLGKVSEVIENGAEVLKSVKVESGIDILNLAEVLILMPADEKVKNK